jgi:hypothetical protein
MKRTTTKAAPVISNNLVEIKNRTEDEPGADYADFAAHVARVVTHPQTPKALRSALQAIAINIISNETGYEWCSDAAGLRFILSRCLNEAGEDYARGIIHATQELIADSLPEALRQEFNAQRGGAACSTAAGV